MSRWSDLPEALLEAIEERIVLYADKVKLRSVCVSWMYSTLPKLPHQEFHQSPCLLLPCSTSNNSVDTACGLFSPLDKKFYHLEYLPELEGKLFKGSSHGWVVTSDDSSSLCLLNPLTRAQLKLPPRSSFPHSEKKDVLWGWRDKAYDLRKRRARKIILSTSPANDDYLAVATYGKDDRLAYCRKGYTEWVHLHCTGKGYGDIMVFRGKLYALDEYGHLLIWEIGAPMIMKKIQIRGPFAARRPLQPYLVEYSGGLLRVDRIFCEENSDHVYNAPTFQTTTTCGFKVYKLDVSCEFFESSWFEVRDLGGDSLFLGKNSSSSISSGDFPGYKGNHIYFTDDSNDVINQEEFRGESFDMGIYNINDWRIESLHVPGYEGDGKNLFWPPPIWVMPKAY